MKKVLIVLTIFLTGYSLAFAQRQVSGKVTDARDNSPLSGVSVNVKGTSTGTTTGADGEFRINAAVNSVLVFSS